MLPDLLESTLALFRQPQTQFLRAIHEPPILLIAISPGVKNHVSLV